MNKGQRNSIGTTVFYKLLASATEIRSGYLYKSPPQKKLTTEKSWKRRFFSLIKVGHQQYQFWYFRSSEDKDNPIGSIDLTGISTMCVSPHNHHRWGWVQKTLRCSASCVLYMRTDKRDYFLVGDTSEEVDGWHSDLNEALKDNPHQSDGSEMDSVPRVREKKPAEVAKDLVSGNGEPVFKHAGRLSLQPPPIPPPKSRSLSDPSSAGVDNGTEWMQQKESHAQNRKSAPLGPIYKQPRSVPKLKVTGNGLGHSNSDESLYVNMKEIEDKEALDKSEVTEGSTSTIMRCVTSVYDSLKTNNTHSSTDIREMPLDDGQLKRLSTGSSSYSSGPASPVELQEKRMSINSIDFSPSGERDVHVNQADLKTDLTVPDVHRKASIDLNPSGERDFCVNQADLKKHLTLSDVDGKPSVLSWTGPPQTLCLFHKGDQILGVNDLHTCSVEEFNMYISKSLKNEVKLTILRRPGCQPQHLPNCPCTD